MRKKAPPMSMEIHGMEQMHLKVACLGVAERIIATQLSLQRKGTPEDNYGAFVQQMVPIYKALVRAVVYEHG